MSKFNNADVRAAMIADGWNYIEDEDQKRYIKIVGDAYCLITECNIVKSNQLMESFDKAVCMSEQILNGSMCTDWIHEDELPENYPYDEMFQFSRVDVVRLFPPVCAVEWIRLGYNITGKKE